MGQPQSHVHSRGIRINNKSANWSAIESLIFIKLCITQKKHVHEIIHLGVSFLFIVVVGFSLIVFVFHFIYRGPTYKRLICHYFTNIYTALHVLLLYFSTSCIAYVITLLHNNNVIRTVFIINSQNILIHCGVSLYLRHRKHMGMH